MYIFPQEVRRAYESMPVPLAYYQEIDGKAVVLLVSDGLCRMMRADRDTLIALLNDSLLERVHPDDVGRLNRMVGEFARRLCGYDLIYRSKYASDQDYHYVHSIAHWQTMPDGTELAVFLYTDITDSEGESKQLAESYEIIQKDKFYTDTLTGLPNINFLHEFAEQKVESLLRVDKTPVAIYFDTLGLGAYNNRYGYARGDGLLKLIADVLKNTFTDGLVARAADDHFIVVAADSEDVPERIEAANGRIRAGAYGNTSGIQAGICKYAPGMRMTDALDHARQALKQISDDLNVRCKFYSVDDEASYWESRYILEAFDKALENNWIKVYYQAIMRLKTGKACEMEALARWIDPARGLIPPGKFIPVLERYHLLHRLDLYMVEQICREIPEREAAGIPIVPVSVNFSAQDFDYVDVPRELNRILDKYGVDRGLIIVEITEQDLAMGTEPFKRQLRELRDSGYRLWLDDFGSGYSALNVLSQFEFDLLKFDLEFLRNIDKRANRSIMAAMVGISRELGIQTLAEGMETDAQQDFLRQIGCDLAQGFYFSKPTPLDALLYFLKDGGASIVCETPEELSRFRAQRAGEDAEG